MPGFKQLPPLGQLRSLGWMGSLQHSSNRIALYWVGLNILIAGCLAASFISNTGLAKREMRQANLTGQRATIDPLTGLVSLGSTPQKPAAAFDVSEKNPHAEKPATEPAAPPAEPAPADNRPEPDAIPTGMEPLRTAPLANAPAPILAKPLTPAPAPEITETLEGLPVPKRNGSASPATLYAQKFTRTPEQRLLTFVVLDVGISTQSLPLIAALPREVTAAFSPYTVDATSRIHTLRSKGREVWTMLPTITTHYPQDDPGPLGLIDTQPQDETLRRLRKTLSTTIGSVGAILPIDDELATKSERFSTLLAELDARGMAVLSTHPTHNTKQLPASKTSGNPLVRRADVILDAEPDEATIEKKLDAIPAAFEKGDSLVVVLSARPQSLLALAHWLELQPAEKRYTLAPLSAQWLPKEAPPAPEVKEESGGHGAKKEEKPEEKKSSGGHH